MRAQALVAVLDRQIAIADRRETFKNRVAVAVADRSAMKDVRDFRSDKPLLRGARLLNIQAAQTYTIALLLTPAAAAGVIIEAVRPGPATA